MTLRMAYFVLGALFVAAAVVFFTSCSKSTECREPDEPCHVEDGSWKMKHECQVWNQGLDEPGLSAWRQVMCERNWSYLEDKRTLPDCGYETKSRFCVEDMHWWGSAAVKENRSDGQLTCLLDCDNWGGP